MPVSHQRRGAADVGAVVAARRSHSRSAVPRSVAAEIRSVGGTVHTTELDVLDRAAVERHASCAAVAGRREYREVTAPTRPSSRGHGTDPRLTRVSHSSRSTSSPSRTGQRPW